MAADCGIGGGVKLYQDTLRELSHGRIANHNSTANEHLIGSVREVYVTDGKLKYETSRNCHQGVVDRVKKESLRKQDDSRSEAKKIQDGGINRVRCIIIESDDEDAVRI